MEVSFMHGVTASIDNKSFKFNLVIWMKYRLLYSINAWIFFPPFFSFALQYVTWWHYIPCAFVDWFKKQHYLWIILLLGSVGLPCVTLTRLVLLRSAAGSCREAGVMHVHAFRTFMTAAAGWGALQRGKYFVLTVRELLPPFSLREDIVF